MKKVFPSLSKQKKLTPLAAFFKFRATFFRIRIKENTKWKSNDRMAATKNQPP